MVDISGTLERYSLTKARAPVVAVSRAERQMKALYTLAMIAVLGGLTFNAFLCFVNTRVFAVHDSTVMLGELIFIGCASIVAMERKIGFYLSFGVFLAYMIFLFAMRHQADPKAVRDILIPFVFYCAGMRLADIRLADKLVTIAVIVVVIVGLFEYLATEVYLDYFNVLGYYLSRGSLTLKETFGHTRGLFISGLRPEPRTILPFLGQQRVSSVFLEPVSIGNFGVIVYAWTLYRKDMRWRWLTMIGGLSTVVMADARFGLYTIGLMTLLYPFYHLIARQIWLSLPFLMLAGLAIYGIESGTDGGPDNLVGRLQVTAHILAKLSAGVVFGSEVTDQYVSDSGLAYTLTQFGLLGFIGLWGLFVFLPAKTSKAWAFHSMAILYFFLLLIISNSGYSIKTAALFWFMLGTSNAMGAERNDQSPAQDLSSRPGPRSALS